MASKKSTLEILEARGNGTPQTTAHDESPQITITAPKMASIAVKIRGTTPYVQNRFSGKALEMMKATQEAGSAGKKGRKRDAKNFMECYEGAKHVSKEGWLGIPAPAFRAAGVDACRLVGFKMTFAKLGIFIEADGFDVVDGTPLVRITKGEPRYVEHPVRNASGVADIRARPMWDEGWEAIVRIRFDADMFTATDVINLLARIGAQVGIGEGRNFSKNSTGQGWGCFQVVAE